jgi:hypothetical protein
LRPDSTLPPVERNPTIYFVVGISASEGVSMDNVTLIRVVAGICFVIVLVVLIQRRRKRVK